MTQRMGYPGHMHEQSALIYICRDAWFPSLDEDGIKALGRNQVYDEVADIPVLVKANVTPARTSDPDDGPEIEDLTARVMEDIFITEEQEPSTAGKRIFEKGELIDLTSKEQVRAAEELLSK